MKKLGMCLAVVVAFGAGACGDDDGDGGGGGGGGTGGVSGSKPVSEVTGDDAKKLCEALADRYSDADLTEATCTLTGILAKSLGQDCEMVKADCIKESASEMESCDEAGMGEAPDCPDVTVGEYFDCIDAALQAQKDLYADLTCDSDPQTAFEGEQPETPAACKAIQEKCPELLDDGEDEVGAGSAEG